MPFQLLREHIQHRSQFGSRNLHNAIHQVLASVKWSIWRWNVLFNDTASKHRYPSVERGDTWYLFAGIKPARQATAVAKPNALLNCHVPLHLKIKSGTMAGWWPRYWWCHCKSRSCIGYFYTVNLEFYLTLWKRVRLVITTTLFRQFNIIWVFFSHYCLCTIH